MCIRDRMKAIYKDESLLLSPNPVYLGASLPTHPERKTNMPELKRRCKAMHVAWEMHKSIFTSRFSHKPKRIMFVSLVYESAISGLTAYALSEKECALLDSRIVAYGRKMLLGDACTKTKLPDGSTKYRSRTCLLYTSPSPRDVEESRMPSSA